MKRTISQQLVTRYFVNKMDGDGNETKADAPELHKVSIKIPPFWIDRPEIWFYQVEAQFKINGIVSEDTKFNYLVSQLEPKFVENIWDIVMNESNAKYSESKTRLLDLFKESESTRIKRLITGIELGNMKPSQLLQKLKSVATSDVSENLIKTLWLEKLPDSMRNIILVSSEQLPNLAVMADKIAAMNPQNDICSVSACSNADLLAKIQSLEQQISQLNVDHISRPRSRNNTQSFRGRSQSSSRKRFNPRGKFCFYHFRFGSKCHPEKCTQPCSWVNDNNPNSGNANMQ